MEGFMGLPEADPGYLQKFRDAGIEIQEPICHKCLVTHSDELKALAEQRDLAIQEVRKNMVVCTINPYPPNTYEILGIISGHVALGTGPISELLSSWTDFFGAQSETYNAKMREAEAACLQKLTDSALEMGANAVVGINTTYAELTRGHGMLLVCMNGTAIKRLPKLDRVEGSEKP